MKCYDQLSLNTSVFGAVGGPGRQMADFLELVNQSGFRMVELSRRQWYAIKESLPDIRKSGLKVWSVHGVMDTTVRSNLCFLRTGSLSPNNFSNLGAFCLIGLLTCSWLGAYGHYPKKNFP